MKRKVIPLQGTRTRKRVITLFATLILFGFLNFVFINFMGIPFSPVVITGNVVNDTGIVEILIVKIDPIIDSPENITYNFGKGDPYIIALNVSADFSVDEWEYSLYDLRHGVYTEEDTPFTPNWSISAVRWGNLLTVSAKSDEGTWYSSNVTFYVDVPNSAPLLGNISEPVFFCEGNASSFRFNASDVDEDVLTGDISPKDPFYLDPIERTLNISFFDVVHGSFGKDDVGAHNVSISVVDTSDEPDSRDVTLEVIEINNLPVMEGLGAQTVWLTGDDSVFQHTMTVDDVEDGITRDGNLNFSLIWGVSALFDIGLNDGFMNYTPVVGHHGRVYDLQVCVEDNALSSIHENISLCLPDGGDENIICDNFTLTVTDENRAPEIVLYTPVNDTFVISGTQVVEYSVSVYDADGTVPDIDWYVNDVLVEHNENISDDTFSYSFGCGVSGAYSVGIVTSDGLLNDSQTWYVDVTEDVCPVESSGGGGGGGGGDFCIEDWVCGDWDVCQSVERSFDSGMLSLEDYSVAKESCIQNQEEDERFCGFQITSCIDLSNCSRVEPLLASPAEKRFCYFTEDPGCYDGITNCHDGACELLVDCGGPCDACSTCSDREQNQGEAGVDCGGPCPYLCEPETPFSVISSVLIVVSILLVIIILLVMWKLFLLWKKRDDDY
jgi:hypothetical protein